MKNTTKTFGQKAILALVIALCLGAHGYSNDRNNPKTGNENAVSEYCLAASVQNLPESHKSGIPGVSKTVILPVDVKNIWKDMPSYDKYGNEITARARFNMQQNALLSSDSKNSSAIYIIAEEIK